MKWLARWKLIDFKICRSHFPSRRGRFARIDENHFGEGRNLMSNSLMRVPSFLQTQFLAMKFKSRDERNEKGNRRNYPYSTGKDDRRLERTNKKEEDLECELQLSPMDVYKILVNGIELIKDSTWKY